MAIEITECIPPVLPPVPTSAEALVLPDRQQQLEAHYLALITGGTPKEEGSLAPDNLPVDTWKYVLSGGGLRHCLAELRRHDELAATLPPLTIERQTYLEQVLRRPGLRGHATRHQERQTARTAYVDGVLDGLESILDAKTPQAALELRQMPTLVAKTNFDSPEPPTMADFAGNHLAVLVETLLKEDAIRHELVDRYRAGTRMSRLLGNRALRMTLVGGVLVATVSPNLHFIPIENQATAEDVEVGLGILSATVFGAEAPEAIRQRYRHLIHARRNKQLFEKLAENEDLSDTALRIVYDDTRYDPADHSGTDDKQENLRRFSELDEVFTHFNDNPGGKPYSGERALSYAARLLFDYKPQLDRILAVHTSPVQRRELYLEVARDILTRDVIRMEERLNRKRIRQAIDGLVGIVPAVMFPGLFDAASIAAQRGHDVATVYKPNKRDDS